MSATLCAMNCAAAPMQRVSMRRSWQRPFSVSRRSSARILPANPDFVKAVTQALDSLIRNGSQKTYETFRSTHP